MFNNLICKSRNITAEVLIGRELVGRIQGGRDIPNCKVFHTAITIKELADTAL